MAARGERGGSDCQLQARSGGDKRGGRGEIPRRQEEESRESMNVGWDRCGGPSSLIESDLETHPPPS